jgi:hypothetical protein
MDTIQEREDAIVRSIKSGDNVCGTLRTALDRGRLEPFLRAMVRPTLQVYEDEEQQLRADRDANSRQAEAYRQALEYVASNARAASQAHLEAYAARALGRG